MHMAFFMEAFLRDEEGMKQLGIQNIQGFVHCATILENLISALTNHTAQVMLEKVITETGMMDQVLRSANASWRLQLINRFLIMSKI